MKVLDPFEAGRTIAGVAHDLAVGTLETVGGWCRLAEVANAIMKVASEEA